MGNDFFRFRQFTVRQGGAAMKVGVDSVLLGAWVDAGRPLHILDAGAGTGILSLMMAQRYPDAKIDAVEIDEDACLQAQDNVAASRWGSRIRVWYDDFFHYAAHCALRYDLLISNPPYFTASLPSSDAKRNLARHDDRLPHGALLTAAARLLTPVGLLAIVLPPDKISGVMADAVRCGLHLRRMLQLKSRPAKPVYRTFMELSSAACEMRPEEHLCIEEADLSGKTDAYQQITKDFYL